MAKETKGFILGRDTINGQFVKVEETRWRPDTTVREVIPKPGYGTTGRYDEEPPKKKDK